MNGDTTWAAITIGELATHVIHAASTMVIAHRAAISERSWPIRVGSMNAMTTEVQASARPFHTSPDLPTGRMVPPWVERKTVVVERSNEPKRQSLNTIEESRFVP